MQRVSICQLTIYITMRCTLKCKLCSSGAPYYEPKPHYDLDKIYQYTSKILDIAYIEKVCITGGEPLLHGELAKLLKHLVIRNRDFGKIEIITNATLLPGKDVLACCIENRGIIYFLLDDYGPELSKKSNELMNLLNENGVLYKYRSYHGDVQHHGGWVDFTDMSPKGRTPEETEKVFLKCPFSRSDYSLFNLTGSELSVCNRIQRCRQQGYFTGEHEELLNLSDEALSPERLREWIVKFKEPKRLMHCDNCPGYGDDVPRHPAAEQL